MIGRKALVFDVIGELAHFKTYYTNASSVSYGFPPRTVITGMIAAILGYGRNSYYDDLSPSNSRISISLMSPIKKCIQTVNYVKTKDFKSFNSVVQHYLEGKVETYPTSVEIVMPCTDLIRYRIYFSYLNSSKYEDIYGKLKRNLKDHKTYYSVYLGITEFLADVEFIGEFDIEEPIEGKRVMSAIPEELFGEVDITTKNLSLVVERMPVNFKCTNNFRKLTSVKRYIYERNAEGIPLKTLNNIVSVNGSNIAWMP